MASGAVPKDKSVENQIWLEDIYNYLYTQKGNDPPPPIHIPSTVMLKYQRPCAWFSSRYLFSFTASSSSPLAPVTKASMQTYGDQHSFVISLPYILHASPPQTLSSLQIPVHSLRF